MCKYFPKLHQRTSKRKINKKGKWRGRGHQLWACLTAAVGGVFTACRASAWTLRWTGHTPRLLIGHWPFSGTSYRNTKVNRLSRDLLRCQTINKVHAEHHMPEIKRKPPQQHMRVRTEKHGIKTFSYGLLNNCKLPQKRNQKEQWSCSDRHAQKQMAFTNAQPFIKLTFHLQTLQPKNIQIVGLKYRWNKAQQTEH